MATGKSQSADNSTVLFRIGKIFLDLRWYVIVGLGVLVFLFEFDEIAREAQTSLFADPHINTEFILYLSIILLVGLLAEIYARLLKSHSQALNLLNLKHDLSQYLTASKDWGEVCKRICQKIGEIGPFDEVLLLIYNPDQATFKVTASWNRQSNENNLLLQQPLDLVEDCPHPNDELVFDANCHCITEHPASGEMGSFCYTIFDHQDPIAKLIIRLLPGQKLEKDLRDLLNSIQDELSSALKTTRLRQVQAEFKVESAIAELRQVISQDLHDTIGQNLCLIRMKLDQYTQPECNETPDKVKSELSNLRELANDSYELVRGLLIAMRPKPKMRLEDLLRYHARLVSDRTGISINVFRHDQPHILDPGILHHVYFIFREALHNVEKHAQAQKVDVDIHWGERELLLTICDDGIGFNPNQEPEPGHLGMTIMVDRARKIGGQLEILSSTEGGTQVSLQLPLTSPHDVQEVVLAAARGM